MALFPQEGADLNTLPRHADTATDAATAAGRTPWRLFEPSMQSHALRGLPAPP